MQPLAVRNDKEFVTGTRTQLEKLEKMTVTIRWNISSGKTYILGLKSNITDC